MALSAADLQRRHNLEGAPDPFPSLSEPTNQAPRQREKQAPAALDTQSEDAFPSLASASPAPAAQTQSAWGSGPRIKAPVVPKAPVYTDSFTLATMDLSNVGRDGKAASLGEVIKIVMNKYKVKIEASGNQRTRQTTFHIKAESQKDLDKAQRSLLALTSPVIELIIDAPVSTIPFIIGAKGATLKHIRDQTSVRVDIPKRDQANGRASGKASPTGDEEEEEPTLPVTLSGPQPLAYEAQEMIMKIIRDHTPDSSSRVKDIPAHILPFVIPRRASFLAAAEGGEVTLKLDQTAREITITGDREAVGRVAESIKVTIEYFKAGLTSIKINLPKRQHRLLSGTAAEQIMAQGKCSVTVPPHDDAGDEVTVWGQAEDLPSGLSAVMEQANSKYIHEFPLPGPINFSKEIVAYISRVNYVETLQSGQDNVEIYLPSTNTTQSSLSIDLIGDKTETDAVVKKLSELIGKLISATRSVNIDWLLHRFVQGKNAKKLKQYYEAHNVNVYFPPESEESSSVLLVYDPFSAKASPIPDEKRKHLDVVEKDLSKLAKDVADVKTVKVDVEKKWHEAVVGNYGTTLNAIIGEDTTLSIKLGTDAGEGTEDIIVVHGISADVDRVVKEINKIVEDAKNDHILSSYFTDFEIEKDYVGRVVGAQGAGINKLRDQLGVKVDVSDDGVDEKDGGKKKTHQKSKITITGRKENVEEAKKRILAQVERLADETSEVIKIPSQYHSSLIGQGGKYAIRLEEKYAVKITFPRSNSDSGEGRTREPLKADEVLLKGGKKGVAQAKAELLDALEFEKENNHSLSFNIPTRAVAKVLGRGGSTINEIKNDTGATIDVEKGYSETSEITLKGTKEAISEAKAAILAISDQVGEETTETLTIESKYHRAIIGAGGQGLRELIAKCNGPTDSKTQAGLIRFPRQGETGDEVRLRGEPKLVAKLKTELESLAAALRDRVIFGVEVPAAQHRALIGRGGAHLNEVQDKFSVQIQIPGSRSYGQIGEPQNSEDLEGIDAANIVKVTGSRSNVDSAIAHLKSNVKPPPSEAVTKDITVPLKYHQSISQQGNFFRTLRSFGVTVDHSAMPTKAALPSPPAPEGASEARIDDAADAEVPSSQWQVVENYQDVDEGDSTWTLKGKDDASLARAEKLVEQGIENAAKKTHVGYLTLADRSSFPRIVGTRGANVQRLRDESGAEITVGRDNNVIVIVGSQTEIENAKTAVLELAGSRGQGRRRND